MTKFCDNTHNHKPQIPHTDRNEIFVMAVDP